MYNFFKNDFEKLEREREIRRKVMIAKHDKGLITDDELIYFLMNYKRVKLELTFEDDDYIKKEEMPLKLSSDLFKNSRH